MGNRHRKKNEKKQESTMYHPACCYQMLTKPKNEVQAIHQIVVALTPLSTSGMEQCAELCFFDFVSI